MSGVTGAQSGAQSGAQAGPEAPLRVMLYRLEPGDALAWEGISPGHGRRDRIGIAAACLAGLGLLQGLAGTLRDAAWLHSLPAALILMLAPAVGVWLMARRDRRRRAAARIAGPVETRLEIWPSRLVESRADGAQAVVRGLRSLRAVRSAAGRVFLGFGGDEVIILPRAAFASEKARAEFVAEWRERIG